MTKNKKIILVVIIVTIIIMSFICGRAYAKYISKLEGKGTAEIAYWSFKVNNSNEKVQKISLNSTVNNEKILKDKIAPGTKGTFQIKLDATDSDVAIGYSIKFENETNKPHNLKFEYENKTYNHISELQSVLVGIINAEDKDKIRNININWNWPFETGTTLEEIQNNDKIDTEDSKTIRDYTFDVRILGIQEIPQQ